MTVLIFLLIIFPFIAAESCFQTRLDPVCCFIALFSGTILTLGAIQLAIHAPFFVSSGTLLKKDDPSI